MRTGAASPQNREPMRLDPACLPARYRTATAEAGGQTGERAIYLDQRMAIVKRRLAGLPLTLSLPLSAFNGVAVRIVPDEDGSLWASVELNHRDPALSLPLTASSDMESIATDWAAWAQSLGLPMLLVEADGSLTPADACSIEMGAPGPRRRGSVFAGRRPRFLARRKAGAKGQLPVVSGREIIARS